MTFFEAGKIVRYKSKKVLTRMDIHRKNMYLQKLLLKLALFCSELTMTFLKLQFDTFHVLYCVSTLFFL